MTGSFETVGLIGRSGKPRIRDSLRAVIDCLEVNGRRVLLESDTAKRMGKKDRHEQVSRQALGECCDLIIVVGGDGSLIGVSVHKNTRNCPLRGGVKIKKSD